MNYGEKIAELRKKRGMTQDDLGKAMSVSYQAVSKWERGESQPDFDTMTKIAKLFGVPLEYFAEDGAEEGSKEESKTEAPAPEPVPAPAPAPAMLGVCTVCGKMLKEGEAVATSPKIICRDCAERQEKSAREAAELAKKKERQKREAEAHEVLGHGFDASLIVSLVLAGIAYVVLAVLCFSNLSSDDIFLYGALLFLVPLAVFGSSHAAADVIKELKDLDDDASYSLKLSLIIGACFAVVNAALFLALYLNSETDGNFYFLLLLAGGAILSFTFVSQFLWGGIVKAIFTAGGFTFKLPGFIITLDIDSILWMIVVKFLLGILAAIIFVVTTAIVAIVAILGSFVLFIPCVLLKARKDATARASIKG